MASKLSEGYLKKVETFIFAQGEIALKRITMRPEQRYRARLALEAYHAIMHSPTADPRQLLARLSARDYEELLEQAALGNEEAKMYVETMQIRRDPQTDVVIPRTYSELKNDVELLNWLVGRFNTSQARTLTSILPAMLASSSKVARAFLTNSITNCVRSMDLLKRNMPRKWRKSTVCGSLSKTTKRIRIFSLRTKAVSHLKI